MLLAPLKPPSRHLLFYPAILKKILFDTIKIAFKQIIQLANTIGKDIDIHAEQNPREDANDGFVRLFVVQQHGGINKDEVEQTIMNIMSKDAEDEKWTGIDADVKILTLEHMMAARRLGFDSFFPYLIKSQNIK